MDPTKKQEFRRILANFDTGMLVMMQGAEDELTPQPVAISTSTKDELIWLALGVDAESTAEPPTADNCLLLCERPGRHLAMKGSLLLERATSLVHEVWKPHWQTWFPAGPTSKNLLLARFNPRQAEYWDHAGLMRLTYVFETARSIVRGARRPPLREEHVRF
jgi:general stress protein 26